MIVEPGIFTALRPKFSSARHAFGLDENAIDRFMTGHDARVWELEDPVFFEDPAFF
jgi:hypothetical protein